METVFGWDQFTIKSFDPIELGLAQHSNTDFTIELRQQYFYLLWIPCFGLGKKWVIRKNGRLYDLPAVMRESLKQRNDIALKTPWYTYAGILLMLVIALGFFIHGKYQSSLWQQHVQKQFAVNYADNMAKFRQPSLNDYYIFTTADGYITRFAKVTAVNEEHIQLACVNNTAAWAATPAGVARLFTQHTGALTTITINRQDAAALICASYNNIETFKGIKLNSSETNTFRVSNIIRLDGAILKNGGFETYADNGSIHMEIRNEGLATIIKKIEPVAGNIQWSAKQLPLHLPADRDFLLNGQGNLHAPYVVKITCTDSEGKDMQWLIEGKGFQKKFTKVTL